MQSLDSTVATRVQAWLDGPYDDATKAEIKRLLKENPQALADAFYRDLSFGTGGMRGIMGIGTDRMNVYTVQMATQALANYLKTFSEKEHTVFIGYDVRHHSREFALDAARVLAGNGIRSFLTKEICPTPLVSFGCRYYECSAGIMITASHNPPQYNGFKVYWEDGGQVVPPHDEGIMQEAKNIHSLDAVTLAEKDSLLIHEVGEEFEEVYLKEIKTLQLFPDLSSLKIVYSNLHGTGFKLVPQALQERKAAISIVKEQFPLDPDFSAAPKPNPEEPKALELGIAQLLREKADLFLATDPDADRVAAVVREKDKAISFSGNQTACLCLHHICEALTQKELFPPNAAFVKSIVTTELFRKIAESYGGVCIDVLTGFKYIAEKIHEWEASFGGYQYVFGAEESLGYLFGTLVRDKDAISSSCLIAEAAAIAKKQNLTLHDRLHKLYKKYGIHRTKHLNLAFSDSPAGTKQMQSIMKRLRENPPLEINRIPVLRIEDCLDQTILDLKTGDRSANTLPQSDVLSFWLKDKSKLIIRPSGTEPKIKIYAEVVDEKFSHLEQAISACDKRLDELLAVFQKALSS